MKKIAIIIIACAFSCCNSFDLYAHKKAKYDVVIDTDCGKDDFRAITYFLASLDFNVNAIVTSGGVLSAAEGATYMASLLKIYHHEGILLEQGKNPNNIPKTCGGAYKSWHNIINDSIAYSKPAKSNVLKFAIDANRKKTIYVALGPLTNLANLVKESPEIISKIDCVLWSADFEKGKISGFNYDADKQAFEFVRNSKIPIKIVNAANLSYSDDFLSSLSEIKSAYSSIMSKFFINEKMNFCDDLIPFYILNPELFDNTKNEKLEFLEFVTPKKDAYFDILARILLNTEKFDGMVIFSELPISGYMLLPDVRVSASEIIKKNGLTEFKLVALCSEMHSHLGVYSIIGVKMGLRILEFLHVGTDEIAITSNAGLNPPISCLNDGLQLGSGTTLGYGNINVLETKTPIPSIEVYYNGRTLRCSLKKEIITEISADIDNIIKIYGLNTDMYWSELRKLSIEKYWLDKSRNEIFEIIEM